MPERLSILTWNVNFRSADVVRWRRGLGNSPFGWKTTLSSRRTRVRTVAVVCRRSVVARVEVVMLGIE